MVVTHDQRLIKECECTLWVVEKQGVTLSVKGFDANKTTLLEEIEAAVEKEAKKRRDKLGTAAIARAEKLARISNSKKNNDCHCKARNN